MSAEKTARVTAWVASLGITLGLSVLFIEAISAGVMPIVFVGVLAIVILITCGKAR